MIPAWILPLIPLLGAAAALLLPRAVVPVITAAAALVATVVLLLQPPFAGAWLHRDPTSAPLLLAVALVGLAAAIAMPAPAQADDGWRGRLLAAALPALQAALTLALLAHNLGLMWVAIEAATLITVAVLGAEGTRAGMAAAWRLFLLGGTGIALALFGTVVLFLAAGGGMPATTIAGAAAAAPQAAAPLLNLAFVFLLVGYGTKAGLAPLHLWVADAHAEGPAPITGAMAGLLSMAALHAIWRSAGVVGANPGAIQPALWLTGLGMASVSLGALALWHRRDARRFLGMALVKSAGVALLAMAWAPAALTLILAGQACAKAAGFIALGSAAAARGGRSFAGLAGLVATDPRLGWPLVAALLLAAGLPPGAPFMGEVMTLAALGRAAPLVGMVLALSVLVALVAWLRRIDMLVADPPPPGAGGRGALPAVIATWGLVAAAIGFGLVP